MFWARDGWEMGSSWPSKKISRDVTGRKCWGGGKLICRGRKIEVESMAKLWYVKSLNRPPLSISGLHTVRAGFVCLHTNRAGSLKWALTPNSVDISCWKE